MARWLLAWTLFIAVATAGSYAASSALLGRGAAGRETMALQPLAEGGPGTTVCRRAQRALIDAAAGADPDASPELQSAWDGAARGVLQACADA
jgi:hypothetical protein